MATYAIGDIHGNRAALEDLLAVLGPELGPGDQVVFLGDYVDDGPDVAGCIERILELRDQARCDVVALMGNHEQWMLRSRADHSKHSWLIGMAGLGTVMSYSHEAADALGRELEQAGVLLAHAGRARINYDVFFEAMPERHLDFFLSLRSFHESPDVLCAHGGIDHTRDVASAHPPEIFIWGPPGFPDTYGGTRPVVYGHHNNAVMDEAGWPGPRIGDNATFGIDTIRHGVLTAMRFPDQRVFQSRRFLPS